MITACVDTWDSVKRGITGQKQSSTDEFLVEKKDPLVLPPDFEDLPMPSGSVEEAENEISSFEKTLSVTKDEGDEDFSSQGTTEESILNKIRKIH